MASSSFDEVDKSKCYALISSHPGGLTLQTYRGIARDLLTFVTNFLPGMRALECFCTSVGNNTAILKMKDLDRGGGGGWVYSPIHV